ncbi:trypsin-like peptidase domain-containing protein [Streptomyces sp. CRN 30]|uniref:trypsin-like peptidase domain-containing protein n=1 Tax=Streptomyces sp. CRN 30 TaxID=3075613 RepID=UPI002A7EF28B|nr:trypsin-like peptidase domain-containing protein [Streptomyces sp. CRN 30]
MTEGKPTKAKWWGRPRPQGAGAGPAAGAPGAEAALPDSPGGGNGSRRSDGGSHRSDSGDFELRRPDEAPGRTGTSDADDFELARPLGPGTGAPGSGTADDTGDATAEAAEDTVPATAGERPRPLHDPDPYSTPPYGEPGPWAPAPPVQHPAATSAHGTDAPATAPPEDRTVPSAPSATMPPAPPATMPAQATVPPGPAPASVPTAAYPAAPAPAEPPQPAAPATVPPPRDPWQNYDPWAAAQAPLQQSGAAVPSTDQRRTRARRGLVLGAVLLALVSGGVGGAVGAYLERNGGIGEVHLPQAAQGAEGRAPGSVAGIAASALPGVVTLHVSGTEEQGTGTGFVLDERGHILTNNHVVQPAGDDGRITVTFSGGETAKAELVGGDSGYDLAVVKVSGVRGLSPLPLGNSDDVRVGDPVVAIGAPFDLANTVTAGIISAKERPITAGGEKGDGSDISYVDALQTDAPINPGNSGGPLVDANARVIGINSAIRSGGDGSDAEGQAGSIGLGFAIPINQGKRVAEELINTGRASHPVIGVTLDMDYSGEGARVGTEGADGGSPVGAGGPAAAAGVEAGDVITEVDGQRIHSGEELIVKIRAHRPGDRLHLTVRRDGQDREVSVVLGSSDGA